MFDDFEALIGGYPRGGFNTGWNLCAHQEKMAALLNALRYRPAPDTAMLFAAAQETLNVKPMRLMWMDGATPRVVASAIIAALFGLPSGLLCSPEDITDLIGRSVFKGARQLEKILRHEHVRLYYRRIAEMMDFDLEWPIIITAPALLRLFDKLDIELVSMNPTTRALDTGPLSEFLVHRLEGSHSIAAKLKEQTRTETVGECVRALLKDEKKANLWRSAARVALKIDNYELCVGGSCYESQDVARAALVCMKEPGQGLSSQLLMTRRIAGPGGQGMLLVSDPAYDPYVTVDKRISSALYCAEQLNWLVELRRLCGLPCVPSYVAPFSFSTNGSAQDEHVGDQIQVARRLPELINLPYVHAHPSTVQLDAALELVLDPVLDVAKLSPEKQGAFGVCIAPDLAAGNAVVKALCLLRALVDRAGPGSHFTSSDPQRPWETAFCPVWDLSRADSTFAIVFAALNMVVFSVIHDFETRAKVRQRMEQRF